MNDFYPNGRKRNIHYKFSILNRSNLMMISSVKINSLTANERG